MFVPLFKGNGVLEYSEIPEPCLDEQNNVLIELECCGICGTDLNILSVPPLHKANTDMVIGHEAVGKIAKLGTNNGGEDLKEGDRVVVAPRILCGYCSYCRMGLGNQCDSYTTVGTTRPGAFAPYLAVPHTAVYRISNKVAVEEAAFFEPLSCVIGALSPVNFQLGDRAVVIGAGPMGAIFALALRAMGASSVTIIDISESRLQFLSSLGLTTVVNPTLISENDFQRYCRSFEADLVVDAVGNQAALCITLLRRGGSALLFGLKPQQETHINQYEATRYDKKLYGAFVGLHPFVQTIKVLESGALKLADLLTHRFPLSKLLEGIEVMRRAEGMKVLVDIKNESE